MKHTKIIISIIFLLVSVGRLHAQESPASTGGEATGTGGTVSYSVGQVIYTTNTGVNGSIVQGVQQPYEISTTASITESSINLELCVYPNPTTSYLTLKVEITDNINYLLFDMQGKLIESKKVSSYSSKINLEEKEEMV